MHKLVLTEHAQREIDKELLYSEDRWGKKHARKYAKEIHQKLQRICENPSFFPLRKDILPDIRIVGHKGNKIIYMVDKTNKLVIVLGFLSTHQMIDGNKIKRRMKY